MNNKDLNIKRISFLLLIQLALLILSYFELFHFLYNFWNLDVKYLFTENITQLQSYYPSYYWLVFAFTRLLKFGTPFFLLFLFVRYRKQPPAYLKTIYTINLKKKYWWKNEILLFISSLILSLFFYYIPQYLSNNQLAYTRVFIFFQEVNLLLIVLFNLNSIKLKIYLFFQEAVLPYALAITRILIFAYSIFLYLFIFRIGFGNFNGLIKGELPGITWLINIIPVNNELYLAACILGAVVSFMIMIGYKTRFFLALNILIMFYVASVPNFFGKLWHQQIIIWIPWILTFSPCYDVLSIDSILKKKPLVKSANYGFHLKIILLHFGLIYFFAGINKLWVAGFHWALSASMINQVQLEWFENYNKIPSIRIDKFPLLLKIGGLSAILFEISFIFFLLHKKTRWISAIGGLLLHNVIGYFMHISFLMTLQVFYIVFIPWNKIFIKLGLVKQNWIDDKSSLSFKKLIYIVPIAFLILNFFCGLLRIDTYPFSAYPAYTDIVSSQFKYFEYHILDKDYENINLWQAAQESNFRWENFSRFEPEIINEFETTGVLDTIRVIQQWQRWQNGVPILNNIDSIEVYAVEINLAPEKMNDTISKYKILNLTK